MGNSIHCVLNLNSALCFFPQILGLQVAAKVFVVFETTIPHAESRFQGREHGGKKRTEKQKVPTMLKQLRQFGETIFIEACMSWQWTLWKLGVIIQSMISLTLRGVHCTTVWGRCVFFFSSLFHSSLSLAACGANFMKERMKMALCAPCYLEVYQHLTVNDAQLYRRYLGDCPVLLWYTSFGV